MDGKSFSVAENLQEALETLNPREKLRIPWKKQTCISHARGKGVS